MARSGYPPYTDADLATVISWYREREHAPLDLAGLARKLGRSKENVCRKARSLGLTNKNRQNVDLIDGLTPTQIKRLPKFRTKAERDAAAGARLREAIERSGHPRGMKGKAHTAETKAKIAIATSERAKTTPPEEKTRRGRVAAETRVERYGSAAPSFRGEDAYSRSASGKREDLGGLFLRSSWEANYARYLNWLVEQNEIRSWEYEATTFVFHGETRGAITYRPDFKVTENDGSVVYHEVKGWMDGPSKTRLRRMAKHYPGVKIVVIGQDEYNALKKWRGLIPNWETGSPGPKRRSGR